MFTIIKQLNSKLNLRNFGRVSRRVNSIAFRDENDEKKNVDVVDTNLICQN